MTEDGLRDRKCGGIPDTSYFVQLFKKYQGVTPKEYARTYASISPTENMLPSAINKNPD